MLAILRASTISRQRGTWFTWRSTTAQFTSTALPPKPRRHLQQDFNPKSIESGWYEYWETRGLFEPRADSIKPPIRMLLPPPNITGELHIGHALMLSIHDAMARYYRMNEYPVIWAPGTDHAGIATTSVVERMLESQRGVTGRRIGRQAFVQEVEAWRTKYGGRILKQMKEMGASTTRSREYYTKDEGLSRAVSSAFVKLWEQGLVYRDTRMVNWSTKLETAVSDMEVITKDINKGADASRSAKIHGAEFGVLHHFSFPLVEGDGEIVVSTTRPETIPGDRAIAVHPDDERYKDLHYKLVRHPLIPSLVLPIVPDAELVDPSFGTGAVKITPAHDANDYAFWKRHSTTAATTEDLPHKKRVNIPLVPIFNSAGIMLPSCQVDALIGRDRLDIRRRVVNLLKEAELYRGYEDHAVRVPICERSGAVIEPMLQPQWYLRMKPLAQKLIDVVTRDGLKFVPNHPSRLLWDQWLDKIQDWCLSRQIWWGHRIPAYQVISPSKQLLRWIAAESEESAYSQLTAEERKSGCTILQDEDVLDTWFSSGLLPLSTAGWPNAPNWEENYPLTFIESGGDILFFWLARMALLSTHFSDKLPFPEILLHPLVCDAAGRKMSKSVGNVLDPLLIIHGATQDDMITAAYKELAPQLERDSEYNLIARKELRKRKADIRKFFPKGITQSGADPLRMALVDYTRQSRHISMELRHVDVFRRLAIKLDNAVKFWATHAVVEPVFSPAHIHTTAWDYQDLYIIYHTSNLIVRVDKAFQDRRLYDATEAIRSYIYDVLCGVYVEFVKKDMSLESPRRDMALTLLRAVLDVVLRLLHPFMPFHSEALWQELAPNERALVDDVSIMTAKWPSVDELPQVKEEKLEVMVRTLDLVEALRSLKEEDVMLTVPPMGEVREFVRRNWSTVKRIGKVGKYGPSVELVGTDEVWEGAGWFVRRP